jgi:hypothetical protein
VDPNGRPGGDSIQNSHLLSRLFESNEGAKKANINEFQSAAGIEYLTLL